MKTVIAAVAVACASIAMPAAAEVYKWTDKDGTVHFGDQRPAATGSETVNIQPPPDAGIGVDAPVRGPAEAVKAELDVLLYATQSCGYCKQTRALLERRGVSWQEVDIESSPAARAEFKARGGSGVPLLIINGQVLQGFDEAALSATLARYGY